VILRQAQDERNDVLAFLRKRRRAAQAVAKGWPQDGERAEYLATQIGVMIEMIEQGLHLGDAEAEAAIYAES